MAEQNNYRVVFAGDLTGEYDLNTTKRRFSKVFRLDEVKVHRLFSGLEYSLKTELTETRAMEFAIKLVEIGCECWIDLMPNPDDISQQSGFIERRKGQRRFQFRRGPRTGAVIPDRRMLRSRRKIDIFLFDKHGAFPGNTIAGKD